MMGERRLAVGEGGLSKGNTPWPGKRRFLPRAGSRCGCRPPDFRICKSGFGSGGLL